MKSEHVDNTFIDPTSGKTFRRYKYFDREVIQDVETGWINAGKFVMDLWKAKITKKRFAEFKSTHDYEIALELGKTIISRESRPMGFPIGLEDQEFVDLEYEETKYDKSIEEKVFLTYNEGYGNEVRGTYVLFEVFQLIALWADKKHKLEVLKLLRTINEYANIHEISAYKALNEINEKLMKENESLKLQHENDQQIISKQDKLIKDFTSPYDRTKILPMIYALPVGEKHFQLRMINNSDEERGLRSISFLNVQDVLPKIKQELMKEGLIISRNRKLIIPNEQIDHVFELIEMIKNNGQMDIPTPELRNDFIDKQLKKYNDMRKNTMVEGLIYEFEYIRSHPNLIPWKLIPNGLMDKQGEQKRDNGIDAVEIDSNLKIKTIYQIKKHHNTYLRRNEIETFLNKCHQDRYKDVQKVLVLHECKLSQALRDEIQLQGINIEMN